MAPLMRNGGRLLIDQLVIEGVDAAFLVPGESFLAALDALFDTPQIRTIVCRHEGGASMMAEATGRLTGRPGVAFVTRAPGAANAASGVYVAADAETPMLLFVGLPPRARAHLSTFQDFDLTGLYGRLAKHVEIAASAARLPELIARAVSLTISGRPGPVVIGLPEDVLTEESHAVSARRVAAARAEPSQALLQELEQRLSEAEQPILIVGGPRWTRAAQDAVQAFALRFDLPVCAAFRAQDYIDNRHPSYCGHIGLTLDPTLASALRAADLIIVLGAPLDEVTTAGWSVVKSPDPAQHVVHIHPGATHPRDGIRPQTEIVATADAFAAALRTLEPPAERRWSTFRRDLRQAFEKTQRVRPTPGRVQFAEVVRTVSDRLPEHAVIASGAGNFSQFVHRYITYKAFGTSLAPASGSMGYGLPAAIAAKVQNPNVPVVAFAGDGCFLMTAQELATAVQYDLPIVVIVADNGMYGTIRMHQERAYPGRVSATSLVNPDFEAFAKSFGANAVTITETEAFPRAFEEALASSKPSLIVLKLDPEAITPDMTLSQFRTLGPQRKT